MNALKTKKVYFANLSLESQTECIETKYTCHSGSSKSRNLLSGECSDTKLAPSTVIYRSDFKKSLGFDLWKTEYANIGGKV